MHALQVIIAGGGLFTDNCLNSTSLSRSRISLVLTQLGESKRGGEAECRGNVHVEHHIGVQG